MLVDEAVRNEFASGKFAYVIEVLVECLPKYDLSKNLKYLSVAEAALSVLVNLNF